MKTNFHTHTLRCGHARGGDEEYVQCALEAGFQILGFSDHMPYEFENGKTSGMPLPLLEDYIDAISALKDRYRHRIALHLALECEPIPRFFPLLREVRKKMDYLIIGNHGDPGDPAYRYAAHCTQPEHLRPFLDAALQAMDSGLFSYMAHPDIVFHQYPVFDRAAEDYTRTLCKAARECPMPLEYNLLGIQKHAASPEGLGYPCRRFWEIAAEENATAIIGVDAHTPQALLTDEYEKADLFLKNLGIQVTRTFPF